MRMATGNIWVTRKLSISWRRPGKLNRDNAYPVVAESSTPMTIVDAPTITELTNHSGKWVWVTTPGLNEESSTHTIGNTAISEAPASVACRATEAMGERRCGRGAGAAG